MEEINRLFIYYIDRLKPHIKYLSLSVLDDPLFYQDKLDDIICISLLTGYKLSVNIDKSCSMLIGSLERINNYFNRKTLGLKVMGTNLANRSHYTYLGLPTDSCLTWNIAVSNIM